MNIARLCLLTSALLGFAIPCAHAQTYRSEEVIATAKRYLQEVVGDELVEYFIYDSYSYYSYNEARGRVGYETLIAADSTLGRFRESNVRFVLAHPEFSSSIYPHVKNWIGVRLDKNLDRKDKIETYFIPQFLLEGRPSDYITEEDVMDILNRRGIKEGLVPPIIVLQFDSRRKHHYWYVVNPLKRNRCSTRAEVARIHAVTGEILSFKKRTLDDYDCSR